MDIIKKRYKRAYFSKIISIVIISFLVFFVFTNIVYYLSYRNVLTNQMHENFSAVAGGIKKDVEIIDNSMREFCDYIYMDDLVAQSIFSKDTSDVKTYQNINSIYSRTLAVNENIDSIQFYNPHKKELYSIGTAAMDKKENQLKDILSQADKIARNSMTFRYIKHIENMKAVDNPVFSYFVYYLFFFSSLLKAI